VVFAVGFAVFDVLLCSPLQAHHAVQTDALRGLVKCLYSTSTTVDHSPVSSRNLHVSLCVHSVCRCQNPKPNSDTKAKLMEIFHNNKLKS